MPEMLVIQIGFGIILCFAKADLCGINPYWQKNMKNEVMGVTEIQDRISLSVQYRTLRIVRYNTDSGLTQCG
jgi:hypothetical protein